MKKYLCVHGHFYQPPRENAWQKRILKQDSASPYHDWNERITAECYTPNLTSLYEGIENNLSQMSFNFGPTLLAWMREHSAGTYEGIRQTDLISQRHFDECGSAIAQCFNHMIMPLADGEDKSIQVRWAVDDFCQTFGRNPRGMWLPETAVDIATLEVLAAHDIAFTILAPHQAHKIKYKDDKEWVFVKQETLKTTHPYRCVLPSGKSINIFFYNGYIATDVAFGGLLEDGDRLYKRVRDEINVTDENGLVHWAVDGETYGHHHKEGAATLATMFLRFKEDSDVEIINYDSYLKKFPVEYEVVIKDRSAWSCPYNLGRWSDNCGCSIDPNKSGRQQWRKPLRDTLNWLRDEIKKEPIDDENVHGAELRRNMLYMFTSCGWFFDDFTRIETQQILQYALRAVEITKKIFGKDLLNQFYMRLDGIERGKEICQSILESQCIKEYHE